MKEYDFCIKMQDDLEKRNFVILDDVGAVTFGHAQWCIEDVALGGMHGIDSDAADVVSSLGTFIINNYDHLYTQAKADVSAWWEPDMDGSLYYYTLARVVHLCYYAMERLENPPYLK